ncbi:MAG: response regulator transcription factor [Chloroflexi bacterium]|nr:response regulator transcription factor [Chloroflexota bacterium]
MAQRILIADDDRQITRLVQSYLERAGFEVRVAHDGEQALHMLRAENPDMAVLDVMMPGRDGFELARLIRADRRLAALPILMLTARVEDIDKLQGLELGADDYLTKPFNPPELVARVRAILRRVNGDLKPSAVLRIRDLSLDTEAHIATVRDQLLDLTPAEFALLQTFMQYSERAFTRGELIDIAFGETYEGFERTIDTHIKNLRRKIEIDSADPQYIQTVFGVGYKMGR